MIVKYISGWVKTNKTPVPLSEILKEIEKTGEKDPRNKAAYSLRDLLKMGYIRRAIGTSNKTYYVLLRTI